MMRVLAACLMLALTFTVTACAGSPGLVQPAPRGYDGGYLSNPMGGGGG